MKKFEAEKSPQEIAERLFELYKNMDFLDYKEQEEEIKNDLENVLYYIKTICENELNKEYFRTFYKILEGV